MLVMTKACTAGDSLINLQSIPIVAIGRLVQPCNNVYAARPMEARRESGGPANEVYAEPVWGGASSHASLHGEHYINVHEFGPIRGG